MLINMFKHTKLKANSLILQKIKCMHFIVKIILNKKKDKNIKNKKIQGILLK